MEQTNTGCSKPKLHPEQFELYLQPQYRLKNGSVYAAETCLRWNHPEEGVLEPEQFFSEFAKQGLLDELHCILLHKTCQLLKAWMDCGYKPLTLSVTLFGDAPFKPQWTQWLLSLLAQYGVSTSLLILEIKEDLYLDSPRTIHALVQALQHAGINVALDHFGSGVSSIKALNGMGMNILKVDMAFFEQCENLGESEVVFTSIVRVARWLEMKVIAEHVETAQQRDFAVASGCDLAQGKFYSEPLLQDQFERNVLSVCYNDSKDDENSQAKSVHWQKTILVIDDSEMERALVKKYLGDEYAIHEAESAEQAISYLNENGDHVRLILVDNVMPGMSGMDFIRYCHGDEHLVHMPIIMITANDRAADQKQAFRAGAYDYLAKPLIQEVVRARVQHAMELNNLLLTIERKEEEFRHQAETDKATGLLNKATFEERVDTYLQAHSKSSCTLMIVDIDNFKSINDQYGHLLGDEVIMVVADVLRLHCRKSDYVGRFGGDEFVAYFTDSAIDRKSAMQKASDVLRTVDETCRRELQIPVSVSMGIANSKNGESFDELFQHADSALYTAKNNGKGQAVFAE